MPSPSPPAAGAAAPPPPPPTTTTIDRARFAATLPVPAVRIPARACQAVVSGLRGHVLDLARVPAVVPDPDGGKASRLVLLRPAWARAKNGEAMAAPEALAASAGAPPPDPAAVVAALPDSARAILTDVGAVPTAATVRLGYEHFPAAAVLKTLLPPGVEVPTAFETVGHIAHLNLSPSQLEHAATIGTVLLDKNPGLRTVVTKVGEVSSVFRALPLRVIAGEPDTIASVTQAGCRFTLDYAAAYWNSRLEAEHARCVAALDPPGCTVLDVMAGVGPFAIPAAKGRGCRVYANDLNPASYTALASNIGANRVSHAVAPFCVDGRAFIRAAGGVERLAPNPAAPALPPPAVPKPRYDKKTGALVGGPPPPPLPAVIPADGLVYAAAIMNLPATAVEFLDAFRGAFAGGAWAATRARAPGAPPLPTVHVYAFAPAGELEEIEEEDGGKATLSKKGAKRTAGGGGGGLLRAPGVEARVAAALWAGAAGGGRVPSPPPVPAGLTVRLVRDVAPNKRMVRVTFRVPADVAFWGLDGDEEVACGVKRARVDNEG
jgi:tRNA (guanine37-N1)-methyltransferase